MKKSLMLRCLFVFQLLVLLMGCEIHQEEVSPLKALRQELTRKVQSEGCSYAYKKYKLNNVSRAFSVPHNMVIYLGGTFETQKEKTEDELREMIVDVGEYYREKLGEDPKYKPCLFEYPPSIKRVSITILNYDKRGNLVLSPRVSSVLLVNGRIIFFYDSKKISERTGQPMSYTVEERVETFEEAKRIIEEKKRQGRDLKGK